jgi:hypothetical protein
MKITKIRWMSKKELEAEGWDESHVTCLELEDGTLIYPSRDGEGNGGGVLFGKLPNGDSTYIRP